jgi:hypothetical protein
MFSTTTAGCRIIKKKKQQLQLEKESSKNKFPSPDLPLCFPKLCYFLVSLRIRPQRNAVGSIKKNEQKLQLEKHKINKHAPDLLLYFPKLLATCPI